MNREDRELLAESVRQYLMASTMMQRQKLPLLRVIGGNDTAWIGTRCLMVRDGWGEFDVRWIRSLGREVQDYTPSQDVLSCRHWGTDSPGADLNRSSVALVLGDGVRSVIWTASSPRLMLHMGPEISHILSQCATVRSGATNQEVAPGVPIYAWADPRVKGLCPVIVCMPMQEGKYGPGRMETELMSVLSTIRDV